MKPHEFLALRRVDDFLRKAPRREVNETMRGLHELALRTATEGELACKYCVYNGRASAARKESESKPKIRARRGSRARAREWDEVDLNERQKKRGRSG